MKSDPFKLFGLIYIFQALTTRCLHMLKTSGGWWRSSQVVMLYSFTVPVFLFASDPHRITKPSTRNQHREASTPKNTHSVYTREEALAACGRLTLSISCVCFSMPTRSSSRPAAEPSSSESRLLCSLLCCEGSRATRFTSASSSTRVLLASRSDFTIFSLTYKA